MRKREAKLLAKQQKSEDSLSQLQAVSPSKEDYNERQIEFKKFFNTQFKLAKEKYPKRSQAELSKFVNLLWKVEKQNSQIYQDKGKVFIDGIFVDVPQQPPAAYSMFIKKIKDKVKSLNPTYDSQQMNTAFQVLWNEGGPEVIEIKKEYQQLIQKYKEDKQKFMDTYKFWPKKYLPQKKKIQIEDQFQKVKTCSESGNVLSQLMLQKVPIK